MVAAFRFQSNSNRAATAGIATHPPPEGESPQAGSCPKHISFGLMKIANVTHSACIATGISDLSAPTMYRAEREARREKRGGVVRHKSGFKE